MQTSFPQAAANKFTQFASSQLGQRGRFTFVFGIPNDSEYYEALASWSAAEAFTYTEDAKEKGRNNEIYFALHKGEKVTLFEVVGYVFFYPW